MENQISHVIDFYCIKFQEYVKQAGVGAGSPISAYADCEPYKKILNFGKDAVPYLLKKIADASMEKDDR